MFRPGLIAVDSTSLLTATLWPGRAFYLTWVMAKAPARQYDDFMAPTFRHVSRWAGTARLLLLVAILLVGGCSTASYRYQEFNPADLQTQAQTQSEGRLRVTAAVPGQDQAEDIFGFPVYDRGIQPVWLEVENGSDHWIRYAPTGSDREYFSPLEVSYMHRKGYSKEARHEMDMRLHGMGMRRRIAPGETASGFIFTNATQGTKGLYVDLFGEGDDDESFAFFLDVPGFTPDHAQVDFRSLYDPGEILDLDSDGLREVIAKAGCCTHNIDGDQSGLPIGILAIADGEDLLRALLRAGWNETAWTSNREKGDPSTFHYLLGRVADAKFSKKRGARNDLKELRLWLTPWRINGQPVWAALVTHFIGQKTQLANTLLGDMFDPEIDEGRQYLLQNLWYTQSIESLAWIATSDVIPIEEARLDFNGDLYFTDGHLAVLKLSGTPVSMIETKRAAWGDDPPRRRE
jgi:hypothetical protein